MKGLIFLTCAAVMLIATYHSADAVPIKCFIDTATAEGPSTDCPEGVVCQRTFTYDMTMKNYTPKQFSRMCAVAAGKEKGCEPKNTDKNAPEVICYCNENDCNSKMTPKEIDDTFMMVSDDKSKEVVGQGDGNTPTTTTTASSVGDGGNTSTASNSSATGLNSYQVKAFSFIFPVAAIIGASAIFSK